jgi:uracil-DNA glycosylase
MAASPFDLGHKTSLAGQAPGAEVTDRRKRFFLKKAAKTFAPWFTHHAGY